MNGHCNLVLGGLLGFRQLRDTQKIEQYGKELAAKHDEIADIKSAHDSEENIDSQKPVRKNPGLYSPIGLQPQGEFIDLELCAILQHSLLNTISPNLANPDF